jgi:hypothetical protein
MIGKYQLSKSSLFKYLKALPLSGNRFLTAKSEQVYYLMRLSKKTDADFYSNEINYEFYLEDTLQGYI